ncbi:MAG: hypothetical protein Q4Q53_07205 [Methanocorpusculum sp.]|nr:hypothetical protein [Methanocorpusculum sp.]
MARKVIQPLIQTSIRLYESDMDVIRQIAAADDRDPAYVIRRIVSDYVKTQSAA